ncbi:hypothetical protein [Leifsonia poae]|uniref:hypothetical protein n=1 Tax=Leifsonia poae TaxID=110933 RepID=UPI003D678F41
MHPLTLWLTSIAELGEKERDRAIVRRQRETRGEESPQQRDSRWAATMHRLAEQARTAPQPAPAPRAAAPAPQPASAPRAAAAQLAPRAAVGLGCA